jgi:hypothetical protein
MPESFVFIQETGDRSTLQKYPIRRKIRQQAQAYAVKRRASLYPMIFWNYRPASASWTRTNDAFEELKHPSAVSYVSEPDRDTVTPGLCNEANRQLNTEDIIVPFILPTGYERARMTYNVDLTFLSSLTSVHMGKGATLNLGQDTTLGSWMQVKERSYLDYVPMFYDTSQLVKATADCLLARMHLAAAQHKRSKDQIRVLHLYGIALKEMQKTLKDSTRRTGPDVLLATALFQLFEVSIGEC